MNRSYVSPSKNENFWEHGAMKLVCEKLHFTTNVKGRSFSEHTLFALV